MRSRVVLVSILVSIWLPIWTKIRPKIDKKFVSKAPSKKHPKNIRLRSKFDAFKVGKYSENEGGLFKIVLFVYSQRG